MRKLHPVVLAALSGMLLGVGASVLLQQFGVWPLTVSTLVVVPSLVALDGGLIVWALRRRRQGVAA